MRGVTCLDKRKTGVVILVLLGLIVVTPFVLPANSVKDQEEVTTHGNLVELNMNETNQNSPYNTNLSTECQNSDVDLHHYKRSVFLVSAIILLVIIVLSYSLVNDLRSR